MKVFLLLSLEILFFIIYFYAIKLISKTTMVFSIFLLAVIFFFIKDYGLEEKALAATRQFFNRRGDGVSEMKARTCRDYAENKLKNSYYDSNLEEFCSKQ